MLVPIESDDLKVVLGKVSAIGRNAGPDNRLILTAIPPSASLNQGHDN